MSDDEAGNFTAEWTRTNEDGVDETVHGSIEISEDAPTYLIHLTKDFNEGPGDIPSFFTGKAETDLYPVIHGLAQNGAWTAIDSRPYRSVRKLGGGLSDIVLRPALIIKGSTWLHEHELEITEVILRFWDQDEWASWWSWKVKNPQDDDPNVTIVQMAMPEHSVRIGNVTVSMEDNSHRYYFPSAGKLTLEQHSIFRFRFDEPIRLRDFMSKWMKPFGFWVSSGTRRVSGVEMMAIRNTNWKNDSDGAVIDRFLEVIPQNPPRNMSKRDIEYLHRFNDFDFEKQVPLVIDTFNKHETAIGQFLDYIRATPGSPMIQLTTFAQITETFDRSLTPDAEPTNAQSDAIDAVRTLMKEDPSLAKFADDAARGMAESHRPTLASRLSRLDKQTAKLVSNEILRPLWKADIANIRNSVVHGLPSSGFFMKNLIPLQVSVSILRLLFEARLLVALGFTPDEVKKIITVDDPRWWEKKSQITSYLSSFDDFKNWTP